MLLHGRSHSQAPCSMHRIDFHGWGGVGWGVPDSAILPPAGRAGSTKEEEELVTWSEESPVFKEET